MNGSITDFHSRISARAVAAGWMVAFSSMILWGALAGGLGLWNFDLAVLPQMGGGFWLFAAVAWIFSSFCGAYVASTIGRSTNTRDGSIHGIIVWAGSSVLAYTWSFLVVGNFWGINLAASSPSYLFAIFFGDIFALGAAYLGGRLASYSEQKARHKEREMEHRLAA